MGRLGRPSNDNEANKAFGRQPDGSFHYGTDWGHGDGDGVCAMATGAVAEVKTLTDYGKIVTLDHGTLIDGKRTQTRYCHLSAQQHADGKQVKVGDVIERGEDLGIMGATGTLAKGKHLHSELILDGTRVDEQPYQKEANVKASARQIKPGGAKRREEPTVRGDGTADQNYDPTESLAAGTWVEWDYFVRSTLDGGSDDGDNIWLVKDGLFTKWTTTVPVPGDGALAGIKDGGTYKRPTTPPVVVPPVTTPGTGATLEQVTALIAASEKRMLAAIGKPAQAGPVTLATGEAQKIATAVNDDTANRLKA